MTALEFPFTLNFRSVPRTSDFQFESCVIFRSSSRYKRGLTSASLRLLHFPADATSAGVRHTIARVSPTSLVSMIPSWCNRMINPPLPSSRRCSRIDARLKRRLHRDVRQNTILPTLWKISNLFLSFLTCLTRIYSRQEFLNASKIC